MEIKKRVNGSGEMLMYQWFEASLCVPSVSGKLEIMVFPFLPLLCIYCLLLAKECMFMHPDEYTMFWYCWIMLTWLLLPCLPFVAIVSYWY